MGRGPGVGAGVGLAANFAVGTVEKAAGVSVGEKPPTLTSDLELSMIAVFDLSASNLFRLLSVAALYFLRVAEFAVDV